MKRCPECLFIYPETDVRCDFDNTALVVVDDAEIEAATQAPPSSTTKTSKRTPKKSKGTSKKREPKGATITTDSAAVTAESTPAPAKRRRKTTVVIVAVVGLLVSLVGFFVYYSVRMRDQKRVEDVDSSGPDHAKVFEVEVRIQGLTYGRGHGSSKHVAARIAAQTALEALGLSYK